MLWNWQKRKIRTKEQVEEELHYLQNVERISHQELDAQADSQDEAIETGPN